MEFLARVFRARWGAVVVLVGALVLAGVVAKPAADFEKKINNESTTFLPGSAESVAVDKALRDFPGGELVPAVVVYRREGGMTPQDLAYVKAAQAKWQSPSESTGLLPSTPVVPSPDGSAALFTVPLKASGDSDKLVDTVAEIRDATRADLPAGLESAVTGPAGYSADAVKVFGNINGTLLVAAASLVVVLLLIIYRSPIFWLLPILSVFLAEHFVRAGASLAVDAGLTVNGQTQGILLVLVFGAGTDYALLLVARYREELHRHESRRDAMANAIRAAGPPIIASAGTVVAGLLVLTLAEVNGTKGLGPIGAMGLALAAITMLTVLPALLVLFPRWVFWPLVPRVDDQGFDAATRGIWRRWGDAAVRRPRRVWVGITVGLLAGAFGMLAFDDTLTSANGFRGDIESVNGQSIVSSAYPGGLSGPTVVLVPTGGDVDAVRKTLSNSSAVAQVLPNVEGTPGTQVPAVLADDPYSLKAFDAIPTVRDAVRSVEPGARVGGPTAVEYDVRQASTRDTLLLPPLILVVVFVILAMLLRAIVAPALLIASVVVSFLGSLGLSVLFFRLIGAPGEDTSLPLFAFVFLVALGVDYNIFLMARAREETITHGTREGILRALAVTGAVITSAGIVLAGTFAVLGVLPLWALFQIGFVVAFGVLIDTFLVRTFLVPALVHDIGPKVWWPSTLEGKG